MSVISNFPALPNRLKIYYAYLLDKTKGEEQEKLFNLVAPSSLDRKNNSEESKKPLHKDVFAELKLLDLVEEQENKILLKYSPGKRELNSAGGLDAYFLALMENRLVLSGGVENYGQADFPKALAWFLMQNPANPFEWSNPVGKLSDTETTWLRQNADIVVTARFQNFLYWTNYLGYTSFVGTNKPFIIPDPTKAIERHLPNVFDSNSELRMDEFITALGASCPVLENGVVRNDIEAINPTKSLGREEGHLSKSTSLALKRLDISGKLKLSKHADADVILLDWGSDMGRYSHIQWMKG
ncbi:protein DpdG [Candidatus Venteria ishoeyi]|uniref:Uncharacterized protein n=1 Tax=Candidatus Venteria ishoeyi TaxID=1899563 RepID=A0A1H6F8G3_9GAMM|nr:protein DpdG [Candidatus Venteria ishoeyi]SEH06417.1 Uncharacterised protein [Candidatus Venteria ishoeyi]